MAFCIPSIIFFQGFSLNYGIVPRCLNEYELHIWLMSQKKFKKMYASHPYFVLVFNAHAHVSLAQMLMKDEFQSKLPKYILSRKRYAKTQEHNCIC